MRQLSSSMFDDEVRSVRERLPESMRSLKLKFSNLNER